MKAVKYAMETDADEILSVELDPEGGVSIRQHEDLILLTPDEARELCEAIRLLLGDEE